MAEPNPTRTPESKPVAPGDRVGARFDASAVEDLNLLLSTGLSKSEALHDAVRHYAAIHRAPIADDMKVLQEAGLSRADAVRKAVGHYAEIHRNAWDMGAYPQGISPKILGTKVEVYQQPKAANQGV
ncbi:hypothetical protein [Streptomyces beijiangensis]|uniref:Uncharacterized protein n=1 Tax=Streptomyces beijiangensis TaxID=163361 RepID=A0A939F645_9ACTN|nr:hypothetical protein [Streptomyces beijiangensis]MBO0512409.1 hypothetical protein [Streptomyces beijiangensis]